MPNNRRSRIITQGFARSPNRAMLRAVGFGDGDPAAKLRRIPPDQRTDDLGQGAFGV